MKFSLLQSPVSLLMLASLLSFSSSVKGQSNPAPFDLSTGPYQCTAWDSLSPKGTFPESMVFHYVAANQTAPFYTDAASDYDCSYKKSKRPRINGLMNQGIAIVTTSSPQYNDCNAGAADSRFMGDILLSLNATGRNNIIASWKCETVTPGDGDPTQPRVWNLRLQYRVGDNGLFTDVPGLVEFISSPSTGDSLQFGPITLPEECNGQPIVQLRWIYFESSAGIVGGSRPQIRLDDVEVTSDNTVGISEILANGNSLFSIFPNPTHAQFSLNTNIRNGGKVEVVDQVGKLVIHQIFNHTSSTFDCSYLPKGIYFVKVTDISNGLFKTQKLIIQ